MEICCQRTLHTTAEGCLEIHDLRNCQPEAFRIFHYRLCQWMLTFFLQCRCDLHHGIHREITLITACFFYL